MRFYGRFATAMTAALAGPLMAVAEACVPPDRAALLILDASYSMRRGVARTGTNRFNLARQAVAAVVNLFPPEGYLALRFYGSESQSIREDCLDTKLAVPFAPAAENRDAILLALADAHARGLTPIAYALQQAVSDFPGGDLDKLIIVVSDGIEACAGDPCGAAIELGALGFTIHTVGFVVNRSARAQLQCIAAVTGGTYFDVPVAVQLPDKLKEAFSACPIAFLREEWEHAPVIG